MKKLYFILLVLSTFNVSAQKNSLRAAVSEKALSIEQKVIAWRRDLHEHPELGNNEMRTADLIARHLRSLGIEVKTGVAKTGVLGILKGGKTRACRSFKSRYGWPSGNRKGGSAFCI